MMRDQRKTAIEGGWHAPITILCSLRPASWLVIFAATVAVSARSAEAIESTTFANGRWFPFVDTPEHFAESNIWTAAVPGVGDVANILHIVDLRNDLNDALADGVSTVEVGSLNLSPSAQLNVQNGLLLNVQGSSAWTGGVLTGHLDGGGTLGQRGVLTLSGNIPKTLLQANLENTGQIVLTDDGPWEVTAGTSIANLSGVAPNANVAIIDLQSDADIVRAQGGAGNAGLLLNRGVIRKSGGAGRSEIQIPVNHAGGSPNNMAGRIEVLTGVLALTGGSQLSTGASFHVADGAVLEIGGADVHQLAQTIGPVAVYTGSGGGHVRFVEGATIDASFFGGLPNVNSRAVFQFEPGMFQWEGGTIRGGTIQNNGEITLTGAGVMDLNRGRIFNEGRIIHAAAGTLRFLFSGHIYNGSNGLFDIQSDGGVESVNGGFIQNQGIVRKSAGAGTSYFEATIDQSDGRIEVLSGTLRIRFVQQIRLGFGTLARGTYVVGPGSTLQVDEGLDITINQATIELRGIGSTFAKIAPLADNQGSFEINGGRQFDTVGALANSGFVTVGEGSTLTVNGVYSQSSSGVLRGKGHVAAEAVVNDGTIHAGQSLGLPRITGNYEQTASGLLEIRARGPIVETQYEQLAVSGSAELNGTLAISFIDDGGQLLEPALGDRFTILSAQGGVSGTFSAVHLSSSKNLLATIEYNANDVTVEIIGNDFLAADFNEDRIVDNSDFEQWKLNFGLASEAVHLDGDADGDRDVDGDDFVVWQRQLGMTAMGSLATIPEPTTAALGPVVMGVLVLSGRRRRRLGNRG